MSATPGESAAYIVTMISVATLLGFVYSDRGFSTCLSIVLYVLALSTMSILVKNVFAHGFEFPQFTTACHFLTTATVGCLISLYRNGSVVVPNSKTLLYGIMPVAMCVALSIGMANMGLVYCSAHFYEMFSNLACLVTAGVGVAMGRPIHSKLYMPLLIITGSLLIVSFGEISFSAFAVVCLFFGVLFRAMKAQLQSLLLSPDSGMQQLAPLDLVTWSCLSSFVVMAAWSIVSEGSAPVFAIQKHGAALAVVMSTVPAVVLNISALYVLKELGPVAQQAVGAFRGVLACVGAVVVFGEVITMQQLVGYPILIAACMYYNRKDAELKRQAKEAAASEKTPLVDAKQV